MMQNGNFGFYYGEKKKVTDAGIKFLMPEGIVYFISTNMPDWVKSVSTI